MKKTILACSLIIATTFFATSLAAQQQVEFLNTNNVNAGFGIGGNLFSLEATVEPLLYEVPKGTNKRTIFTAALWLSALDSGGGLHGAAQQYKSYGSDYYDGPIASVYNSAYDNYFQRVFKITETQIAHDLTLTFPAIAQAVDSSILLWPGKGNTYVASAYGVNIASSLAPFVDIDNDGVYNPLMGDYPSICGNEAIFFVFNDARNSHTETTCPKLGVEIRGLAYEFSDTTSTEYSYGKRAINNTVFVQYDIENKSVIPYNNFYISLWEDPDLGCFNNDRVGCDTNRNLMFVYNGSTPDVNCQGEIGYTPYQVSQGIIMLNQNMSSFAYFTNGTSPDQSDPFVCQQYRNYMTGFWEDGTPFSEGGTGFGGSYWTKFLFPGDPNDLTQWSEYSVRSVLPPGDRRMTGTVGPMNFNLGEIKHFDLAFTTSYDSTNATFISIVDTLKRDADIVQAFYNNNVVPCRNQLIALGINQHGNDAVFNVSIFPNPAKTQITIEADVDIESLTLTDMTGRLVMQQSANAKKIIINVASLAKGVYLLKLKSGNRWRMKKMVIE